MSASPVGEDRTERIAELLRHAARAHHHAFAGTDGVDPEWPMWYAAHLHGSLGMILDHEFTESELVYHLMRVDRRYRALKPETDWPEAYAEYFVHADL